MSTPALQRSVPLQEQLRQLLREKIVTGQYAPGSEFPSESDLAQEYELSRATVRGALSALVAEGLLVRHRGIGTTVTRRASIADSIGEALDFAELISSNGFTASVTAHAACVVPASDELASELELEPGTEVLRVELVFYADGNPVIYCVNAIPTTVLGDTLSQVLLDPTGSEPIFAFLEQRCQQRIDYHMASLWADVVANFAIPITCCPPPTPMLVMKSVAYNQEGQPVFHSISAYPDPRIKFTLNRQHKPAPGR